MKRTFTILALLLALCMGTALAAGPKAKMDFSQKVFDFGLVKEDAGPVEHSFDFTNSGDANLIVYDAKADCGCTMPQYPKQPVGPGKSGTITVKFNPIGRAGAFDKVITVRTNGKPGKIHLKIRGQVVPKKK